MALQTSDIPSLVFGDNEITSIFAQKKFAKIQGCTMCCYSFTYSNHFDFCKKMGFTCIFENNGEKSRKNRLENEFCILPREVSIHMVALLSHFSSLKVKTVVNSTIYLQTLSWPCSLVESCDVNIVIRWK